MCAASHAIQAASTISERICIASEGNLNKPYSPQAILACSQNLEGQTNCESGFLNESMDYTLERGKGLLKNRPAL